MTLDSKRLERILDRKINAVECSDWRVLDGEVDGHSVRQDKKYDYKVLCVVTQSYKANCVTEYTPSRSGPPKRTDPPVEEREQNIQLTFDLVYSTNDLSYESESLAEYEEIVETAKIVDYKDKLPIVQVTTPNGKESLRPKDLDKETKSKKIL
jgi:hypothetical protein